MRFVAAPHFAYFNVLNGVKQNPGPKTEKTLRLERTPGLTLLPWLEAEALHRLAGDFEHCEAEAG